MSVQGEAKIGKPAPTFTVKAVVEKEFVDINSRSVGMKLSRKYVPVGALFLLFCCIVYFKFSHIRIESAFWDNFLSVSQTASNIDRVRTASKVDSFYSSFIA